MSRSDSWPEAVKTKLLVACHRRCCVCHKFCGGKIELHHIDPAAKAGEPSYENAIALCFDCHAEVGHYNIQHPRGTRFTPNELRGHREQWLRICREHADTLGEAPRFPNPGPLQSLVSELEFNRAIASRLGADRLGSSFEVGGLQRVVADGTLLLLDERIVRAVQDAFIEMRRANTFISAIAHSAPGNAHANAMNLAQKAIRDASESIAKALGALLDESSIGTERDHG